MSKNITPWGKQCKIQMISLGKSLADLSKETGFSRTYISAIINGRVVAPDETIERISKGLDMNPRSNFILKEM